jgi:hypothetical protein
MGLCTTSKIITEVERSESPRTITQGICEWVTIIECMSSQGISIPPVVLLKGKEHQAPWYQEPNLLLNWKLTNSANGWMTDEIGLAWLKYVIEPFPKLLSTGAKRLLILDGIQVTRPQSLMNSARGMQLFVFACLLIHLIFFNH